MIRILLVQDAQTQGNSTRQYLQAFGYDVIWAGSGMTALIAARKATVDLILLDVALPDMEGHDLCRTFRRLEETRTTPILLLAGRGFTPVSFDSAEERPDDYIEKPYTEKALNTKILSILRARTVSPASTTQAPPEKPASTPQPEPAPVQPIQQKPHPQPILKLVPKQERPAQTAAPLEEHRTDEVIDPSTGLFSKHQFEAMVSKAFKQCVRFKQQMSCMLIDLDGAKMGRKADEKLIKAIIALVQTTIREVDTAAWWTGESLIVMLPNTLKNDAVQAAARVLEAVATHDFTWPDSTRVTMSIGVSGLPDKDIDSEQKLIEAAAHASRNAQDLMAHRPDSLEGLAQGNKNMTHMPIRGKNVK
jgi:diguanylate cyclase (GGDEF)-like protein